MPEIDGLSGVVIITREGRPIITSTGGGCTSTTRFQVASVSKNFASMLTMMLVEEGLLDLHEPLDRWLPERLPPARRGAGPSRQRASRAVGPCIGDRLR